MISALFEPDMDINIEVSTRHQTRRISVSNAASVKTLSQVHPGIFNCGIAPERLEIRLRNITLEDPLPLRRGSKTLEDPLPLRRGSITLEDPLPLHFYGIKEGSTLDMVKRYVSVKVENNKGTTLCWRLKRKDTIGEVKVKLATSSKRIGENPDNNAKVEQLYLYTVTDGRNFNELDDDDETVENYEIKDGDMLYLMSYMWTYKSKVTVMETGAELWGLEKDDTCLGVKVKAQEQLGMPVSTIKLVRLAEYKLGENPLGRPAFPHNPSDYVGKPHSHNPHDYVRKFKILTEIGDNDTPFNYKEPLSIVTQEELDADRARAAEEEKTWREAVRNEHFREDKRNRLEERKKLGYVHDRILVIKSH